jgi:hypothetical protein
VASASDERARDGDVSDAKEIGERKVEADAEHQEDDPEFCQLLDRFKVADETRGERTNENAGQQVSNDGGQSDPAGNRASEECNDEGQRDVH